MYTGVALASAWCTLARVACVGSSGSTCSYYRDISAVTRSRPHTMSVASWAEGTNTRGWARTIFGSAQGPAVSCDVLFSAKSCIYAHGGENLVSTAVCTRALGCEALTPMRRLSDQLVMVVVLVPVVV